MAWLESNVLAYTFLDDYLLRYYFVLINCNKLRHRANAKSSPFECRRFLFKNETDYSTCNLSNIEENEMAFDSWEEKKKIQLKLESIEDFIKSHLYNLSRRESSIKNIPRISENFRNGTNIYS